MASIGATAIKTSSSSSTNDYLFIPTYVLLGIIILLVVALIILSAKLYRKTTKIGEAL